MGKSLGMISTKAIVIFAIIGVVMLYLITVIMVWLAKINQ